MVVEGFSNCTNIPLDKFKIRPPTISFLNKLQTSSHITNSIPIVLLNLRESSSCLRSDNLLRKEKIPKIFSLC